MAARRAVPDAIAIGSDRCGFFASPVLNVTYCHPSYAHSTEIIAVPAADKSPRLDVCVAGGIGAPPSPIARRIALITITAIDLISAPQFWTVALRRIPLTLMAPMIAMIATAATRPVHNPSVTNWPR